MVLNPDLVVSTPSLSRRPGVRGSGDAVSYAAIISGAPGAGALRGPKRAIGRTRRRQRAARDTKDNVFLTNCPKLSPEVPDASS